MLALGRFSLTKIIFNPLECKDNYTVTSNKMKLEHWPLMDGLLHLVQRGGTGRDGRPFRPLLAVAMLQPTHQRPMSHNHHISI